MELSWAEPQTVKYVTIQEHIALGQRVKKFVIEAELNGSWQEVAAGTTVGYKRILPISDGKGLATNRLRVRFLDSRAALTIARVAVH